MPWQHPHHAGSTGKSLHSRIRLPSTPTRYSGVSARSAQSGDARINHRHEQRLAGLRFLFLIGVLVFLTLFIGLSIWEKIGSLFGL